MIIGLDIDGVIRDFADQLVNVYQCYYPEHEIKPFDHYNVTDCFPIGEKVWELVWGPWAWDILYHAAAYPGALAFCNDVAELGDLVFVTMQPTEAAKETTWAWLRSYDLLRLGSIFMVQAPLTKWSLRLDILVDDSPRNLIAMPQPFNPRAPRASICFDRPWNQEYEGLRAHNYAEALQLIKERG